MTAWGDKIGALHARKCACCWAAAVELLAATLIQAPRRMAGQKLSKASMAEPTSPTPCAYPRHASRLNAASSTWPLLRQPKDFYRLPATPALTGRFTIQSDGLSGAVAQASNLSCPFEASWLAFRSTFVRRDLSRHDRTQQLRDLGD
jgi:hypothetical protein